MGELAQQLFPRGVDSSPPDPFHGKMQEKPAGVLQKGYFWDGEDIG